MTIRDIIVRYSKELEEISSTPRLDVETLLQKVLNVDRLYILLNLDKSLSKEEENFADRRYMYILEKSMPKEDKNSIQQAVECLLAFYFESCDIFEAPEK